jgi:hypothetical protein
MKRYIKWDNHITKCKLEDGSIVEYDACANERNAYDEKIFRYIGKGYIYEVNGVKQTYLGAHKMDYFFVRY